MTKMPPDASSAAPQTAFVLAHYNTKVTKHLAAALTEAGVFPSEILNEIRGAFTHLAKAHTLGVGTPGYYEENRCAMRHLKRVSLDCLKTAIMFVAEKLERKLDDLTSYVRLPSHVYREAERLLGQRAELMNAESSHPSLSTVDDLEKLFVDYKNLLSELVTNYDAGYVSMINAKIEEKEQRSAFRGFLLGIPAGVVATFAVFLLQKVFGF